SRCGRQGERRPSISCSVTHVWPQHPSRRWPADAPRLGVRTSAKLATVGAGALGGAALWWRKNPSACPYGQRFWVEAPHPIITRDRLRSVLVPEPGERILEIGPGVGYYTLDMAEWAGPGGTIEIFDLQQEFLDHVGKRAFERGPTNIV